MNKKLLLLFSVLIAGCWMQAQTEDRWQIDPDGSITWKIKKGDAHSDHIEMSGLAVSTVLRYGVNEQGEFILDRSMVWPTFRTIPNNTHGSLMRRLNENIVPLIFVNNNPLRNEQVQSISLNGTMEVKSSFNGGGISLERILFPSTDKPMFCEKYLLTNRGDKDISVELPGVNVTINTDPAKGVKGSYRLVSKADKEGSYILKPNEQLVFSMTHAAYFHDEKESAVVIDQELKQRKELISEWWSKLVLDTPDPVINTMFAFAKIRGAESIYKTKGGYLHGPGGESYYAAIWANDQAEYINPFFPFLGYQIGNQSAMDSYLLFTKYMNPEYEKLPSSVIAEGDDYWGGAGDRGDAAMIAYGASRFALASGDVIRAAKLWPLIEWCLEYCKRQLNEEGVVASDSDELEGRFPAGKANLCTSSLYYDALRSAASLAKSLKKPASQIKAYTAQADALHKNINKYFSAEVEGFPTYRYYEGNDVLRSWICIPLTMGIYERKEGTIDALFSPRLWTKEGLLTQAGTETFWDRSTLYALRGVFACGATGKAAEYLQYYSRKRLLGDHVPYAIEAWPEGGQRHLSAESGLYCRILTEGVFGIRPTGLHSFDLTPRLPEAWDHMSLRNMHAFGRSLDLNVVRKGNGKLQLEVLSEGKIVKKATIREGDTVSIR